MDIDVPANNIDPNNQFYTPSPTNSVASNNGTYTPSSGNLENAPITLNEVNPSNEKNTEIYNPPENLSPKEDPSVTNFTPAQVPVETQTPIENKQQANIVDKSKGLVQLHTLTDVQDTLTLEADAEEERFITEVERTHGDI